MSKPGAKPSRLLLWAPFALAALILLAYYLVWREGAASMRRAIDGWAENQRAAGLTVAYDDLRARGFPFFLRGAVANVVIGDARDWSWSAQTLRVDTLPYASDRLIFSATNPQRLNLGAYGLWLLRSDDGRASFENDKGRDWALHVESGPGSIERADGSVSLSAEKFLLSVAPAAVERKRAQASLIIEKFAVSMNGGTIDAPRIEAFIEAEDAADERPAVTLNRIAVEAEGAQILLSGTVRLDEAKYPQGVLDAEIANPSGLAALLQKLGALPPDEAQQAAAGLTLAAIAGGGKIKGPIVLEHGEARIAGVKIADLPQIN